MKAHVEIHIRLDLAGGKTLHDVLREFAGQTQGWTFPLENSLDYQKGHGAPAGFVISDNVDVDASHFFMSAGREFSYLPPHAVAETLAD